MDRRQDLAEFLRSRRGALTPANVAVAPHAGARRVKGLRREEVAQLAGVSVDYYARLEQGRPANYSRSVVDAVARALQLGHDDHSHLLELAGLRETVPGTGTASEDEVRPGLRRILASLTQNPGFVLSWRNDVLATNALADALFSGFDDGSGRRPNFGRFVFRAPAAHEIFASWDETARTTVGTLRTQVGRHPTDAGLSALISELQDDPTFERLWAEHHVVEPRHSTKRYRHPAVGELVLDCDTVYLPKDLDQVLAVYTAEAGSFSERQLGELLRTTAGRSGVNVIGRRSEWS